MTSTFRPEELYKAQGDKTALYFGGRLRVAHDQHRRLSIITELSSKSSLPDTVIVQARVMVLNPEKTKADEFLEVPTFTAHGTACMQADSKLGDSLIELAETRAVSRALRLSGIGVEFVDQSEITAGRNPGMTRPSAQPNAMRPAGPAASQTSHRTEALKAMAAKSAQNGVRA